MDIITHWMIEYYDELFEFVGNLEGLDKKHGLRNIVDSRGGSIH